MALVTGANAGIGQATVPELIDAGYAVIASGRRPDAVETSLAALDEQRRTHTLVIGLDIADEQSVATLADRLPERWRQIDVLVNNAGHDRGGRRRFHQSDPTDFLSVVRTNLMGTMHLTHTVLGAMVERDRGHIVNVGSVQGLYSYPKTAAYTASKFGLHGFSETLRLDYAATGIRVTEILPGAVRTSFAERRWQDHDRAEEFYAKMGTTLSAADVAEAIVWSLAQPAHVDVSMVVLQPSGPSPS